MLQMILVLISFAMIPLLRRFKLNIGVSLIITAVVMAVLNRVSPANFFAVAMDIFVDESSRNTVFVVAAVSVIGAMMKEYKILDKMIESLSALVKNTRVLFMAIPAIVGTLTIPGGAILTAPFVGSLGEKAGLSASKSAAVNLLFRHMNFFLLPFSSTLLVVAAMVPQFKISNIIAVNAVFVIPMLTVAYFVYLKDVPIEIEGEASADYSFGESVKGALIYSSPIYACLITNIITGLPLYICMLTSLIILFFMGPRKGFLSLAVKSISYNTVLAVIGIFLIRGIITSLPEILNLFRQMFETETLVAPAIVVTCLFFGLITGFSMVPLGIVFPMILVLDMGKGDLLVHVYLVYICSFLGYYFSPLHMCQIFTCDFLGVKIKSLYKDYIPIIIFICIYLPLSFIALKAVLPMIFG